MRTAKETRTAKERGLQKKRARNVQEGDKVLLRQEKENKLSTTYKQSPFTVVQKDGNSVLVEADGAQYRRNVTHVKKYLERDNVPQATSKSSDTTDAVTPSSPSPELRESVKVSPGMRRGGSGENLLEHNDSTTWQSDSMSTIRPSRVKRLPSRFQDYVIGCVRLVPE